MRTTKLELELRGGILGTGMLQPVSSGAKGGHLEVLSRLIPGQEKAWLEVVPEMLALTDSGVNLHICRRYLWKDGRMVFGWHLALDAKGPRLLQGAVEAVLAVLAQAKPQLTAAASPEALYEPQEAAPARPRQTLMPGQHPPPRDRVARLPEDTSPGGIGEAPQDFVPTIRVVKRGVDSKGNPMTIEEMPLPHVYRELNRPTHKGGRGAKLINTGD